MSRHVWVNYMVRERIQVHNVQTCHHRNYFLSLTRLYGLVLGCSTNGLVHWYELFV